MLLVQVESSSKNACGHLETKPHILELMTKHCASQVLRVEGHGHWSKI